jgi:tRNA(fMet)-specific endonuclease VapC
MKYLLDTNVCVQFLSGRVPHLSKRLAATSAQDKIVCAIVRTELYYGAYKSQRQASSLATINAFLAHLPTLPFDDAAAQICGEIRADLARKGTPIGPYDLQIAAIALAHNLTLVTHNTREFSRVPNLLLDDWE